MIRIPRIPAIGLLLILLPALISAEEVNIKKLHKAEWLRVESGNFIVITDANEKKAAEIVSELERFAFFMEMMLGYKQNQRVVKVPVIAAKKESTFRALGIPRNSAGVFTRDAHGVMTIFANARGFKSASSGRGNYGRAVILHELAHMLIYNSSLQLSIPPWFSEGIAEYFGTYLEKDNTIVLGDVSVVKNRFYSMVDRLGRVESVDTESLFKATYDDIPMMDNMTTEQTRFIAQFYARSFAVVHYFNADPERRRKMFMFLHVLRKGFPVDEAFQGVFEMTFDELDKQVDDYINDRFMMARIFPLGDEGIQFPEFAYSATRLNKREAMSFLIAKVSAFPDSYLGVGNKEAMLADAKAIYPDLFEEDPKSKVLKSVDP